jgi:tetratricopeptide (TPR) repeat protein
LAVKGLKKARRLFNSGKFTEVVRLLEPAIFQYRESFSFFYLLGVSCLYSGDTGGALSYLKRAQQLRENDIQTLLAMAVVYLKKTEREDSLRIWLKILEIDPKNKRARKGLNLLRKSPEPEDIIAFCDSNRIYSLFPKRKKKILNKVLFLITTMVLASGISGLIIYFSPDLMNRNIRPGMEQYVLPENQGLLDYSRTYRFMYSEKEIREIFNKAKSLFNDYKDNQSIVEINRLLHSNASMDVKSIVYTLRDHMSTPDFSTFSKSNSYSYTEVFEEPYLYENCYILWEGKAGGVRITESAVTFDLWVGNTHEFFGVVPVVLYFGEDITNGQILEVLGKVKLDQDEKVMLEGTALRKIVQDD